MNFIPRYKNWLDIPTTIRAPTPLYKHITLAANLTLTKHPTSPSLPKTFNNEI